jgi:hypothetical protein
MGKMTLEEVRAVVQELSPEDKDLLSLELVQDAIKINSEIEKAWVAESERRLDDFEAGKEETYSREEIFVKYHR